MQLDAILLSLHSLHQICINNLQLLNIFNLAQSLNSLTTEVQEENNHHVFSFLQPKNC